MIGTAAAMALTYCRKVARSPSSLHGKNDTEGLCLSTLTPWNEEDKARYGKDRYLSLSHSGPLFIF